LSHLPYSLGIRLVARYATNANPHAPSDQYHGIASFGPAEELYGGSSNGDFPQLSSVRPKRPNANANDTTLFVSIIVLLDLYLGFFLSLPSMIHPPFSLIDRSFV
jgi:hypothetical protein